MLPRPIYITPHTGASQIVWWCPTGRCPAQTMARLQDCWNVMISAKRFAVCSEPFRPIRGLTGCAAMLNGALPRPKSLRPYGTEVTWLFLQSDSLTVRNRWIPQWQGLWSGHNKAVGRIMIQGWAKPVLHGPHDPEAPYGAGYLIRRLFIIFFWWCQSELCPVPNQYPPDTFSPR